MKVTISKVLQAKGSNVWSVSPDTLVYDALKLMGEKDVGALVVLEGDTVVGMFSERDYARRIMLEGRSSRETRVMDVMSRLVWYVPPWRTIDECMALMTAKRIRHLPVLKDGALVGIVSIGDVVKAVISEQEFAINELEAFVDEALRDRARQA
jgi:CBS domain-containing protein